MEGFESHLRKIGVRQKSLGLAYNPGLILYNRWQTPSDIPVKSKKQLLIFNEFED
jgi:hypothetical protein